MNVFVVENRETFAGTKPLNHVYFTRDEANVKLAELRKHSITMLANLPDIDDEKLAQLSTFRAGWKVNEYLLLPLEQ